MRFFWKYRALLYFYTALLKKIKPCQKQQASDKIGKRKEGENMKYTGNADVKKIIKIECARQGITQKALCDRIGIKPQELNNIYIKKAIAFNDLQRIASGLDMDLYIELKPRPACQDQQQQSGI